MSSRGSKAKNNRFTSDEYQTIETLPHGEEVLKGYGCNHSMPDYSHSANSIYVVKDAAGGFRTMRVYGEDHMPIIEIAHHPEPRISHGNRKDPVWHIHIFKKGDLQHNPAQPISKDIEKRYGDLLEDIGYDQWHS